MTTTTAGSNTSSSTRKPQRFVSWAYRTGPGRGVIKIRMVYSATRAEEDYYFVEPSTCDDGALMFTLQRSDDGLGTVGATYRCRLATNDAPAMCDCPAGQRGVPCKHVGAMVAIACREQL